MSTSRTTSATGTEQSFSMTRERSGSRRWMRPAAGEPSLRPDEKEIDQFLGDLTAFLEKRKSQLEALVLGHSSEAVLGEQSREYSSLKTHFLVIRKTLSSCSTTLFRRVQVATLLLESAGSSLESHRIIPIVNEESSRRRRQQISPLVVSDQRKAIAAKPNRTPVKKPQLSLQSLTKRMRNLSIGTTPRPLPQTPVQRLLELEKKIFDILNASLSSLDTGRPLESYAEQIRSYRQELDQLHSSVGQTVLNHHVKAVFQECKDNLDFAQELSTTFAEVLGLLRAIEADLETATSGGINSIAALHDACRKFTAAERLLLEIQVPDKETPPFRRICSFCQALLAKLQTSISKGLSGVRIEGPEFEQALVAWAGQSPDPDTMKSFVLKASLLLTNVFEEDFNLRALLDGSLLQIDNDPKESARFEELIHVYGGEPSATEEWTGHLTRATDLLREIQQGCESDELETIRAHHRHEIAAQKLTADLSRTRNPIQNGSSIAETFTTAFVHLKSQRFFPLTDKEKKLKQSIQCGEVPKTVDDVLQTLIAKTLVRTLYLPDVKEREEAANDANRFLCAVNPSTLPKLRALIEAFRGVILKKAGESTHTSNVRASAAAATLPLWINHYSTSSPMKLAYRIETYFSTASSIEQDRARFHEAIEAIDQEETVSWKYAVQMYEAILRAKKLLLSKADPALSSSIDTWMKDLADIYTHRSLLSRESFNLANSLIPETPSQERRGARLFSRKTLAFAMVLGKNEGDMARRRAFAILFPLLIEKGLGITTHEALLDQLPTIFERLCSREDLKPQILTNSAIAHLIMSLLGPPVSYNWSDVQSCKDVSEKIMRMAASLSPHFVEIARMCLKNGWEMMVKTSSESLDIQDKLRRIATSLVEPQEFPVLCQNLVNYEKAMAAIAKLNSKLPDGFDAHELLVPNELEQLVEQAYQRCLESPPATKIITEGQQKLQEIVTQLNGSLVAHAEAAQQKLTSPLTRDLIPVMIPAIPARVAKLLIVNIFGIAPLFTQLNVLRTLMKQPLKSEEKEALKLRITEYYPRLLILFSGPTLSLAGDIDGRWISLPLELAQDDSSFRSLMESYQKMYSQLCVRPKSTITSAQKLGEAYVTYFHLMITKLIEFETILKDHKEFTPLLKLLFTCFQSLYISKAGERECEQIFAQLSGYFMKRLLPASAQEQEGTTLREADPHLIQKTRDIARTTSEEVLVKNLSRVLPDLTRELVFLIEKCQDKNLASSLSNGVSRMALDLKTFLVEACTLTKERESLMKVYFQLDAFAQSGTQT